MRFENARYKMPYERSNIIASFAEHVKFPENMTFISTPSVNSGKSY